MKADQFAALINAQQQKEVIWKRVGEVLNGSNRLNDRPAVALDQIPAYLQGEGREVYAFLVSQMLTEVQVECEVLETPFIIPEAFEALLYQSDLSSFFGRSGDYEPVFLYPTGPVTKADMLKLVNAQPFAAEAWEELEKSLTEYALPNIPTTGYPAALDTLDEAALQEISHTICRAIAVRCEQHKTQPIIPAELLHCIGPDELDGKRSRARSRLSDGKQWYLQSIQQPWELYLFVPVASVTLPQETTGDYISTHFTSTLQQIAALATRMQTPYAEAFLSANFLLSDKVPAGQFDEAHENAIVAAMQQQGFSEQATHIFRNNFSYVKDLHLLQWYQEKIFCLSAISMADVFGGMGSWNDIDPGEDALEYQRLSADLFETMKRYFATLLGSVPHQ